MPRRLWHVSSSLNRESIAEHGLDWRRMRITTGIAASPACVGPFVPELEAVFLCDSYHDAEVFAGLGQHPLVDIWEVDADGLATAAGPEGWVVCRTVIPAARMRLHEAGREPPPRDVGAPVEGTSGQRPGWLRLAGSDRRPRSEPERR